MKTCSKCGRIIGFNTRFNEYICRNCGNVEREERTKQCIFTRVASTHTYYKEVSAKCHEKALVIK